MESPWRIQLLGALRAEQGAQTVTRFRTYKTGALLAYLSFYRNQAHPREVLADMLWPDLSAAAGRNNLSKALSSLRHQLEPPGVPSGAVIVADYAAVRLNIHSVMTDVHLFETAVQLASRSSSIDDKTAHLTTAVELYQGELLPGYYEEWLLEERQRLAGVFESIARELQRLPEKNQAEPVGSGSSQWAGFRVSRSGAANRMGQGGESEPVPAASHIPLQFTSFVGREQELGRLWDWLASSQDDAAARMAPDGQLASLARAPRLITLTGAGGSGKTRLAQETALRWLQSRRSQVWYVALADLIDPELIPGAVLQAFNFPISPELDAAAQLVTNLSLLCERSSTSPLLVLDNVEHLLPGAASLIQRLLSQIPALRLLVTSRQKLNLSAEHELVVRPLPIPPGSHTVEQVARCESVRLFVGRAQAVKPDFQVTRQNAGLVAALCRQLEGLPLALELAAARAGILTPAQMLAHLSDHRRAFTSRQRESPARHVSLYAAIDWSYRLLSADLQQFFGDVSVFRGGWTLEAANALYAPPDSATVSELLERLRDCSLVQAEENPTTGEIRLGMLETIRSFAWEQLSPHRQSVLEERHARYYLQRMEQFATSTELDAVEKVRWVRSEQDNLRAVLHWGVQHNPELALGLAVLMGELWLLSAPNEGLSWLTRALEAADTTATESRASALFLSGELAKALSQWRQARDYYHESLKIWRTMGDPARVADSLDRLAGVAASSGAYAVGQPLAEESLAISRERGDQAAIAHALSSMGLLALVQGRLESARELYEESLSLARVYNTPWSVAHLLQSLGLVAYSQGRTVQAQVLLERGLEMLAAYDYRSPHALWVLGQVAIAESRFEDAHGLSLESLALSRDQGSRWGVAFGLEALGSLAAFSGTIPGARRAVTLWSAAEALRESIGVPLHRYERLEYDRALALAQELLGVSIFQAVWIAGRTLPWQQAVTIALEDGALPSDARTGPLP